MDYQEDEYQCSECGTTVQADTEVCPNCNVPLEDVAVDTEFEMISITSNPAEIGHLEPLLKINDIEYSINNDAMDSVFGPSLNHSPTLLVRKDHVDLTVQLLNSYSETNVLKSCTNQNNNSLKGVNGWLFVFCMFLILTPFMELPYIIIYYIDTSSDLLWFPALKTVINIDIVLSILIFLYGIYVGINLWRIHPNAIRSASLYLNFLLAYTIIFFFTAFLILTDVPHNQVTQSVFGYILYNTIGSITFIIIWKSYLRISKRVKNTYMV